MTTTYLNKTINTVPFKGIVYQDTRDANKIRIIVDILFSDLFQFENLKNKIRYLYGNCGFGSGSNLTFTCSNLQPGSVCPRVLFAVNENMADFITFANTFSTFFNFPLNQNLNGINVFFSTSDNANKFLLYLDQGVSGNIRIDTKIISLLTVYEYQNANEIYDVCTEFESRSLGFTSDIFKYYRSAYPKTTWLGVELKDGYTSDIDFNRAANKWIRKNNYQGRNLRMRQLRAQGREGEITEDEKREEIENLAKLFILNNKYWKTLAELYIKNGFTNLLITDKTITGKAGPAPWFLSLILVPNDLVNGNPTQQKINEAMLELNRINNFNFIFKPAIKEFFNILYNRMQEEEAGAAFFIENITWKNKLDLYHILNAQHEYFLGFEDNTAFQTRLNSSRFDWHLHPLGAYSFYKTNYGFPSAGDIYACCMNVKSMNMFSTIYSREGFYLYKVSPPIQNLFLALDNNTKVSYFATKIRDAYRDLKGSFSGNFDPSRVQEYITLNHAINFGNITSTAEITSLPATNQQLVFTPREMNLINLLFTMNCRVFDILYIPNFTNINSLVIEIVNRSVSLPDKTIEFNNLQTLLKNNYYDEAWILKFWHSILTRPEYTSGDVSSLINSNPIYTPFVLNGFVSYAPLECNFSPVL